MDLLDRTGLHEPAASEPKLVTTVLPLAERLLGPREAAAILGLCRDTVYRLCSEGVLEHYRVRNRIRMRASAIEAYLAEVPTGTEWDEG